jgi:hypothetical protein
VRDGWKGSGDLEEVEGGIQKSERQMCGGGAPNIT